MEWNIHTWYQSFYARTNGICSNTWVLPDFWPQLYSMSTWLRDNSDSIRKCQQHKPQPKGELHELKVLFDVWDSCDVWSYLMWYSCAIMGGPTRQGSAFKSSWALAGKSYHIHHIHAIWYHRITVSSDPCAQHVLREKIYSAEGRRLHWMWHQELLWLETCTWYSSPSGTLKKFDLMWPRYHSWIKLF